MTKTSVIISGLALNVIGTIMIAFSFTPSDQVGTHTDNSGKTTDFVMPNFHKWLFRCALAILASNWLFLTANSGNLPLNYYGGNYQSSSLCQADLGLSFNAEEILVFGSILIPFSKSSKN